MRSTPPLFRTNFLKASSLHALRGANLIPIFLLGLIALFALSLVSLHLRDGADVQAQVSQNPDGTYSVPLNWALKPAAITSGGTFRLLFVTTTTRNPQSTDIADYNTHVQNAAATGHAAIQPYSSLVKVLGSTSTVNARTNTSTTGTGEPIYWLNGAKVADNYTDFYDGSWDSNARRD